MTTPTAATYDAFLSANAAHDQIAAAYAGNSGIMTKLATARARVVILAEAVADSHGMELEEFVEGCNDRAGETQVGALPC